MDAGGPPFRRRSIALTVACAIAFAGALQAVAFAFSPLYRELGASAGAGWLPAFIFASSLLAIAFLVILWWRMRRAPLLGYLGVIAAQNAVMAWLGRWSALMLLFPALVTAAAAWTWKDLR
ncbi:MAG TPA: hypothetical protein VEJ89_18315 [Myxococcaceae bacterium]|jgi:hypothetical protein|nr:hypothetical protein [Myxococcaceae bacterium]